MLAELFSRLCKKHPRLRKALWKSWYQFLARTYPRRDWCFMNYGYAPLDGDPASLPLSDEDEDNRYFIQLYHHVASAVDLTGKRALEVGSGRGGGAEFVKRYLGPAEMIGVDLSENAVRLCNRRYRVEGLSYRVGNAEALPFADESFDAVVNVESSHCYPSMDRFLAEVRRVLAPGGHFLYADFRDASKIDTLRQQLEGSGLTKLRETDITANVVRGLDHDDEHKVQRITRLVHKPLVRSFLQFAGTRGSRIYNEFADRKSIYISCVMQKQTSSRTR